MAHSTADELRRLKETAYLLQSPANAARLLSTLSDFAALSIKKRTAAELDRLNASLTTRAKRDCRTPFRAWTPLL